MRKIAPIIRDTLEALDVDLRILIGRKFIFYIDFTGGDTVVFGGTIQLFNLRIYGPPKHYSSDSSAAIDLYPDPGTDWDITGWFFPVVESPQGVGPRSGWLAYAREDLGKVAKPVDGILEFL